jgi:hypothetical protein
VLHPCGARPPLLDKALAKSEPMNDYVSRWMWFRGQYFSINLIYPSEMCNYHSVLKHVSPTQEAVFKGGRMRQ